MNDRASDGRYGHHEESERTVELRAALPDSERCEHMVTVASAFADTHRVRLLSPLAQRRVCIGVIAVSLQHSQSAVSHQLKLLKSLGLVRSTREGKHIYHTLAAEQQKKILSMLGAVTELTGQRP
ncbi:MAG: ArsR/SmtB family transcription factor [Spirochaetota bacterium]